MDKGNLDSIKLPTGELINTSKAPRGHRQSDWDTLSPFGRAQFTAKAANSNTFTWGSRTYPSNKEYPTMRTVPRTRLLYKPSLKRLPKAKGILYKKRRK